MGDFNTGRHAALNYPNPVVVGLINPADLTAPNWYINATTGSDSNSGTSPSTPLKTFSALAARWGNDANLRIPGSGTITVNLQTSLLQDGTDPVGYSVNLLEGTHLVFDGTSGITTVPLTVTSVRARNRATRTPWALTLSVAAGPFVGQRILDQTTGAFAFGIKDEGANVLRTTEWFTPPSATFNVLTNANRATPTAADTFIVQTLPSFEPGPVTGNGNRGTSGGIRPGVAYVNVANVGPGSGDFEFLSGGDLQWIFNGCIMTRSFLATNINRSLGSNNTLFNFVRSIGTQMVPFLGGGMLNGNGSNAPSMSNSTAEFDLDFMFQTSSLAVGAGSGIVLGTVGIFDSVVGGLNADGSGVYVLDDGGCYLSPRFDLVGGLWGTNNAGQGVHVDPGASVDISASYGLANITIQGNTTAGVGTNGDFSLGDQQVNAFSYVLATAAPHAPVTCTWANLAAADAADSGLFYPAKDAGIFTSVP